MPLASAPDWGDVPTWLGALGTLLAFAIALVIYAQSLGDRRRDAARRVSGWAPNGMQIIPAGVEAPGQEYFTRIGEAPLTTADDRCTVTIWIRNRGDELISDIRATLVNPDDGSDWGVEEQRWLEIGPGQQMQRTVLYKDTGARGWPQVRLEFTDAADRRWTRRGGRLRRYRHEVPSPQDRPPAVLAVSDSDRSDIYGS
jgi:hypothetical protein